MNSGDLRHVVVSHAGRRNLVQRTGFVREANLQELILSSPELLGPLGNNLQFAPIGWEVPVGNGALDLLFLDSEGILTLIETKLRANDESRRYVIGQVLEYASYAAEWNLDDVLALATRFYESEKAPLNLRGTTIQNAFAEFFGWDESPEEQASSYEAVVGKLQASIASGKLRVVCGVDERIESLERLIRYFSAHSDIEVALLQVNQFIVDSDTFVLVPTFHGHSESGPPSTPRSGAYVTLDGLLQGFTSESQRVAVENLLEAARTAGASFEFGSNGVSIRARTSLHPSPVTLTWLYPPGKWGWMRTKETTLGHGLDADSTSPMLLALLNSYFERTRALGFGNDASSKGVKATWFSPEQVELHLDTITTLLTDAINELSTAQES